MFDQPPFTTQVGNNCPRVAEPRSASNFAGQPERNSVDSSLHPTSREKFRSFYNHRFWAFPRCIPFLRVSRSHGYPKMDTFIWKIRSKWMGGTPIQKPPDYIPNGYQLGLSEFRQGPCQMVCRVRGKKQIEVMELHWFTPSGDLQLSFFFTMPTKVSATPQCPKNLVDLKKNFGGVTRSQTCHSVILDLCWISWWTAAVEVLESWISDQKICLDMGQAWDTDSANWTVCYAKLPI